MAIGAILGAVLPAALGAAGSVGGAAASRPGQAKTPKIFRGGILDALDSIRPTIGQPMMPYLGQRVAPLSPFQIAGGGMLAQLALGNGGQGVRPTTGPMTLRPLEQAPQRRQT